MHRIHSQRKLSPSSIQSPSIHSNVVTITISNQQNPSQSITTAESTVTVGRNPKTSTLCLAHPSISGSHAVFHFVNNHWTIADVGSLNGTFLNKVRLEPHAPYRLSSDDVLHFGGDASGFTVYFSSQSLDLNSTSFPRGSLSIAKSKSFCEKLNERINDTTDGGLESIDESFVSWGDGRIECGAVSLRGKNKKESEDRYCLARLHFAEDSEYLSTDTQASNSYIFGVFDGHCGAGAAEEVAEAIQEEMRDLVQDVHDTDAYVRAFLATDDRIEDEAGCTATCVTIFQPDSSDSIVLRAANVGDSMGYLISGVLGKNGQNSGGTEDIDCRDAEECATQGAVALTKDHRLTNPEERGRLQSHGVIPEGESNTTYRLYGLNLARALGDRFLKDEDLGLSAEPHVSDVITLAPDCEALIVIASDGLWDVMSMEDAMDMARQVDQDSNGSVIKVATALVREAEAMGSKDDVTVVACRVWSKEYAANLSGGFRSSVEPGGSACTDGGRRVENVDDDLAVGFGGMLL